MIFRQAETAKAAEPKKAAPVAKPVDLKPSGFRVCYRWPIGPMMNADDPFMILPKPSGWSIIRKFCTERQIGLNDLKSHRRSPELVALRHEIAYILYAETDKNTVEIGALLNRDPSSIHHAIKTHKARLAGAIRQWKKPGQRYSDDTLNLIANQRREGWTYPDIATFHGVTVKSARGIVSRAKGRS